MPEKPKLEGQCDFANSELSYPSRNPNAEEGKFLQSTQIFQARQKKYMERGLSISVTDNVEALNTLIHKKYNQKKIFYRRQSVSKDAKT